MKENKKEKPIKIKADFEDVIKLAVENRAKRTPKHG
jgi:hypothetical protein